MEAVKYARDNLYGGADGAREPQWMQYMQDNGKIRKSVAHVYNKLESQDTRTRSRRSGGATGSTVLSGGLSGSAGTPPRSSGEAPSTLSAEEVFSRKRRRLTGGDSSGHVGSGIRHGAAARSGERAISAAGSQEDAGILSTTTSAEERARAVDERVRREVLKAIRGKHVQYLNAGRTDVRANLHKGLMFLKEFIDVHFDPVKRRSKGFFVPEGATALQLALPSYEYVFFGDTEVELAIPDQIRNGSRWDIPLAETVEEDMCAKILSGQAEGIAANLVTLDMVSTRFPCLTVALRYKREVRSALGVPGPPPEDMEASGTIWYQEFEKVSLHDIALGLIVERFKARDKMSALCFSPLSIRTVHVLAIGIRGLLRRSLGLAISSLEEVALGNAGHAHFGALEDKVSTMLDLELEGGKRKVMRAQNLADKMVISSAEYDRRIQLTSGGGSLLSATSRGAGSLNPRDEGREDDVAVCARDGNLSWKLRRVRGRGRGF